MKFVQELFWDKISINFDFSGNSDNFNSWKGVYFDN